MTYSKDCKFYSIVRPRYRDTVFCMALARRIQPYTCTGCLLYEKKDNSPRKISDGERLDTHQDLEERL